MIKKNTNEIKHTAHSSYRCQYHIVFAPKFRRKEIYGQLKKDGDFFDNPIRDFNIKKNEAIFIDDNETLLEVASSKGFEVRLMDREGKLKNSKFKIINDLSSIL